MNVAIIAIEHVMADLVAAEARIASLEADAESYRELAIAAFDALRDLTVVRERDRRQHQQVRDEYRALRERLLLNAGIDDEDEDERHVRQVRVIVPTPLRDAVR